VLSVLRAALPAEPFCRLHAAAVKDARLGCGFPAAEWIVLCTTLLHWLRGGRLRELNHDDDADEQAATAAAATTTPATAEATAAPAASAWEALLNSGTHMRLRTAVAGMPALLPAASAASVSSAAAAPSPRFAASSSSTSAAAGAMMEEERRWRFAALAALHALYEERKLSLLHWSTLRPLAALLTAAAAALGAREHEDHYRRDWGDLPHDDDAEEQQQQQQQQQAEASLVPDMQRALLATLRGESVHAQSKAEAETGTTGAGEVVGSLGSLAPCLPYLVHIGHSLVPQSCRLLRFYRCLVEPTSDEQASQDGPGGRRNTKGSAEGSGEEHHAEAAALRRRAEALVLSMVAADFGLVALDQLPYGLAVPLREALALCCGAPPPGWPAAAYTLVGREDLAAGAEHCGGAAGEVRALWAPSTCPRPPSPPKLNVTMDKPLYYESCFPTRQEKHEARPTVRWHGPAAAAHPSLHSSCGAPLEDTGDEAVMMLLQGGGKASGADALAGVPPYAQRLRPVASADAERVAESSAKKNTQGGVTGMRSAATATAAALEGKVDPNADGMEHLGVARRQRRFGRDLRLKEVRSLLTSATSTVVRLPASAAEVSDPEAIAAAQVSSTPNRPSLPG
jgi:hypothetical protein